MRPPIGQFFEHILPLVVLRQQNMPSDRSVNTEHPGAYTQVLMNVPGRADLRLSSQAV